MASFRPFKGYRYSQGIPLDAVIAPPYDVVSRAERDVIAARHPANAMRVELPLGPEDGGVEAGAEGAANRYEAASAVWKGWIADGVVARDGKHSFYVYRMTPPDGNATTGVVGELGLERPGESILPHEQTIPKDKTDRLALLRHAHANFSAIWGLSLASGLGSLLEMQAAGPPDASARDGEGVVHELWILDDPAVSGRVSELVSSEPIVIADGHHRFETALAFSEEAGGLPGAGAVMAIIVELAGDQLCIKPIHRMAEVAAGPAQVRRAFESHYELSVPSDGAGQWKPGEGMRLVLAGGEWTMVRRPVAGLPESVAGSGGYGAAGQDGAILDSELVKLALEECGLHSITYTADVKEAAASVAAAPGAGESASTGDMGSGDGEIGLARVAVVMEPVTADQIAAYGRSRRRMPPKTTYFWPKPRTGMVFRAVD